MNDYTITFLEPVDLEILVQAASVAFAVPWEQIDVWGDQDFTAPVVKPVIAQVAAGSGSGAYAEFVGFDAFAAHTSTQSYTR
jgi:hypothetical protein